MPVQIDELEVNVEGAPAAGQATAPASPLPRLENAWRLAWLAARQDEQQARLAATDRDDER